MMMLARLKWLLIATLLTGQALLGMPSAVSAQAIGPRDGASRLAGITISVGEKVIRAHLFDTPTSRDLLAQLPATIPMSRLREREYYGRPLGPLSTEGRRREGFDNGDIGYTARSGYLAVFFDNSKDPDISDLIVIGKVTSDISDFNGLGQSVNMKIERSKAD
ncbi:cyclophilin-like fold protein [Agrobacterium fabrum]|uniref:cyclophilin-like fold protein n=1 Tax=Agrobacterium fabrum TaxID=1176649 RepID=UPI002158551E|nr:cyclophilin-like fold protein [Agrobacterium fabrum]MCR6727754.1 cyclophilin-like fold protein [Agrobacterium fabrum]